MGVENKNTPKQIRMCCGISLSVSLSCHARASTLLQHLLPALIESFNRSILMNLALSGLISTSSVLLGHVHGCLIHAQDEGRAGTPQNPLIKMTGPTLATINSIQPQFIPFFRVHRRNERRRASRTQLSLSPVL